MTVNYDPNNGYVENWMFGHGYALHSTFGDLWAQYGLLGLVFVAFILGLVVGWLASGIGHGPRAAALFFLSAS